MGSVSLSSMWWYLCCLLLGLTYHAHGLEYDSHSDNSGLASGKKHVVCYFGSWSVYRQSFGKFDINPWICTHIIYSFAGINNETLDEMISLDKWNDLTDGGGKGAYRRTVRLKKKNPDLKVLLAVGGWNQGSHNFSAMASNKAKRSKFVKSAAAFITRYGFDGLDMDWEYPTQRGGEPYDKENFIILMKELKAELSGRGKLLTVAVPISQHTLSAGYKMAELAHTVDFVNVMAYDYHGPWETFTGHNAPMYSDDDLNVASSIKLYKSYGVHMSKFIMGVPLYGHTYLLSDSADNSVGADSNGKFPGQYTGEAGTIAYHEVCALQGSWQNKWDNKAKVPYMYNVEKWISYDDVRSIRIKVRYALDAGFGGIMVWPLDNDDFHGHCSDVKYPLMTAINQEINKKIVRTTVSPPAGANTIHITYILLTLPILATLILVT